MQVEPEDPAEPPGPSRVAPVVPDPTLPASVDGPRLTVAAAARRLGIAPATLRTWDRRYGIGPSGHQPGSHRRYLPGDVVRLELMQHALVRGATAAEAARYALAAPGHPRSGGSAGEPTAAAVGPHEPSDQVPTPPDGDGYDDRGRVRAGGRVLRLPGAGRAARGLGRAALALDSTAARTLLVESLAAHGVETTWNEVARPVLSAVAERWAFTGAGIEIEHMLSECVVGVFGAQTAVAPPASVTRPVLLAGMPGEQHTLPMVVLAAALTERSVATRSLGSDLPSEALVAAMRRITPVAVVLWSQLAPTADVDLLRVLPRTRPVVRVFVAGPGWNGMELPTRTVRLESLAGAAKAISAVASA